MFVAGWRHALRSEWPFIIIIIMCVYMTDIRYTVCGIPYTDDDDAPPQMSVGLL